jgi:hypothetical protein
MNNLSNRFPEEVREFWIGWYKCLICGKNHADCLHHIISPSSQNYMPGEHNKSIFNACPVNNWDCHIGKPLHTAQIQAQLIRRVKKIIDKSDYKLNKLDKKFLQVYEEYYRTGDSN